MACESRPGDERMRVHVQHESAGRWKSTALLTSYAGTRGGGRKRKKRPRYKCGFCRCYGIKRRIRETPHRTPPSTDWDRESGLFLFKATGKRNNVAHRTVSISSTVWSTSIQHCDKKAQTSIAHCDTHSRHGVQHSSTQLPCRDTASLHARCAEEKSSTRARDIIPRYRCKREWILSVLAIWLATNALLVSTNPSFVAQAAAVPSPSYLSSLSSSLSHTRYKLVPASQHNDSIFIYFNPPSILNLKVNTRQSVFFNFTLYRRQGWYNTASTTNSNKNNVQNISNNNSKPTNKTTNDNGNSRTNNGAIDVPMNDETAGDSATTTKLTTTTTTTLNPNRSNNNNNNNNNNHSQPIPPSTVSFSSSSSSLVLLDSTSISSSGRNTSAKANGSGKKTSSNEEGLDGSTYWVMIYSDDDSIARPVIPSPNGLAAAHADSKGSYILMAVSAGRQHNFSVEARHIGRVTMSVAVVDVNGDRRMPQASYVQAVAASQYPVTAVRGERTADLVFNSSAAAIAIIISFGIGAVTDTDSLKRQLKYPVALIIGFCCQFIIMPLLAFGMAMMLPLDKDIRFGLLCVACVPGGGISHVAVIIADGDTALSLTMNLISVVAMLGTAPLWIFVLGQYFQSDPQAVLNPRMIPIYNFEIWLASTFLAYTAGLIIKRLRPNIADAILMWLIKPFLLLASILYITLGVYINMYVFELVNGYALLGAMLLPLSGCVVGAILAAICRQSYAFIKTIALETSSLNCLVVMVALRFSLKQPDADLAAMIPIWVMFTIPGFFVFLAICNKLKNIILHFWNNRNNKENDIQSTSKAYSVSSSVVSPPGTTTLSAPLVVADGMDDDATISTMSNQKVTVL